VTDPLVIDLLKGQPVGDFYNPFFNVSFLSLEPADDAGTLATGDDAKEITVSVDQVGQLQRVTQSQGDNWGVSYLENPELARLRSYATKLEIRDEGGGASFATLTLEPPFADAIEIVDSRLVQWNTVMVIEWGYLGGDGGDRVSSKRYYQTQQPSLQMSSLDTTITIVGVDLFGYSAMKRETRTIFEREQFKTDLDILQKFAVKQSMSLSTLHLPDDSPLRADKSGAGKPASEQQQKEGATSDRFKLGAQAAPTAGEEKADSSMPTAVEQNESDWTFFSKIVHENRAEFFTVGTVICIVDLNYARTNGYAYRLLFFSQPEKDTDIPLLSFSTKALESLFFKPASKELRAVYGDPDTGETVVRAYDPQKMPDVEFDGKRTAAGKAEADGKTVRIDSRTQVIPNPAYQSNETGKVMSLPGGKTNRDEAAKAVVRAAAETANTDAEATIPGVPYIVPMMLVNVVGVGKTFGGNYLVTKVTHMLGSEGYECQLNLIRNAITGDEKGKGSEPVSGGNTPKPKSGEADSPFVVSATDITE
jgi:hypothetical protein